MKILYQKGNTNWLMNKEKNKSLTKQSEMTYQTTDIFLA